MQHTLPRGCFSATKRIIPFAGQAVPYRPDRFVVLDAMRGVAAFVVVVYHGTSHMFPTGYAAVDLFFVLSGFVLAHRYGQDLNSGGQRVAFLKRRLIRLYPLYAVGTLIGLVSTAFLVGRIDGWTWRLYGTALVFAPVFLPVLTNIALGIFPFDGPAWTLFFEGVGNAVFAFTGSRPRITAAITVLSLPLILFAIKHWFAGGGPTLEEFPGGFARVLFSFFAGVVAYRLWDSGRRLPWNVPWVAIFAVMMAIYAAHPYKHAHYDGLLVVGVQPLLIWAGASSRPGRFEPFMRWLGAISYAVYIIHVPLHLLVLGLSNDGEGLSYYLGVPIAGAHGGLPFPALLITLPLTVAAAHLLTFGFDIPVRRWLTRRFLA
jgi:peptidoglycan/LPS O-acetylase OafA/YrhL